MNKLIKIFVNTFIKISINLKTLIRALSILLFTALTLLCSAHILAADLPENNLSSKNITSNNTINNNVTNERTLGQTCDINSSIIQADYNIETDIDSGVDSNLNSAPELKTAKSSQKNQHNHQTKKTAFTLVRNNAQVAYQFPNKNIIDIWLKYPNQQVALNRYFESQKRVIEYQPTELKRSVNWQKKYQLITHEQIKEMDLINQAGSGCYQQQEYQLKKDNLVVQLRWLPQLNLVKSLVVTQGEHTKKWQLTQIKSLQSDVEEFFTKRYNYQSTDYADIGDNESDPFLLNMINLGFIDHSPQGFYNSKGENISPTGHHH